jgi:hypothetical protein
MVAVAARRSPQRPSYNPAVVAERWSLLVAVAVLCACGLGDALALSIRTNRTQLARSPDGVTLYEVRADGPEGGGSLTYRVQGKGPRSAIAFLVSSDFSPGDGSQPQTVSAEACRQRVTALGAEIAKRKIPGVTVHPDACAAADRNGVVTVAKP